jgi:hypothetical protein
MKPEEEVLMKTFEMKKRFCFCSMRKRATRSDTGKVNGNLYLRRTFKQASSSYSSSGLPFEG